MKFSDLLYSFIPSELRGTEAQKAVDEFVSKIPGRVVQMEFDCTKSNKQGVKHDEKVYKLGLDVDADVAFIEYFENYNQGQPTMAIFVDRKNKTITVNGWTVNKKLYIRFFSENGNVRKTVKVS